MTDKKPEDDQTGFPTTSELSEHPPLPSAPPPDLARAPRRRWWVLALVLIILAGVILYFLTR